MIVTGESEGMKKIQIVVFWIVMLCSDGIGYNLHPKDGVSKVL
jgi:hypothetical protein